MNIKNLLSPLDIKEIKQACTFVRSCGLSIQAIKIGDTHYPPPKEREDDIQKTPSN